MISETKNTKKGLKKKLKEATKQTKKLPIKIKKGGLFGRKRPNFLKSFTNKIAALEKKERDLLHSFNGVNNQVGNLKKNQVGNLKKNLASVNSKPPKLNPVIRPRRKFEIGLKSLKSKELTTTQSTTVADSNATSSTFIGNSPVSSTAKPNNNYSNEATTNTEASDSDNKDLRTSSIEPITSFIPTPPPLKRVGKFPFSFKGPLKPKLLSFSIEKYKKKKSSHKFSTKVKKQLSDKIKALRGLTRNSTGTSNANPLTSESKPVTINIPKVEGEDLDGTSLKITATTESVKAGKPFDRSLLLRNKFKKGRKSFGSKVNLFSKKSLNNFSFLAPTKSSKILPTTNTFTLTNTTPAAYSVTNNDELRDETSSHSKVVFFSLKPS